MENKARLLVVDDDAEVLKLLKIILSSFYDVDGFTNPLEAFNQFCSECYDAVITDIQMDDLSGIELMEKIKAQQEDIPVVLITAYGEISIAIDALRKGAFDFIEKPFTKDIMLHTIKNCVEFSRLIKTNKELILKSSEKKQLHSVNIVTSAIVHEISNPLMHILLYADYLKKDIPIDVLKTSPKIVDHIKNIKSSVNFISDIMSNLRMTIGEKKKTTIEKVKIGEILSGVLQLMTYQLQTNNVRLKVDCTIGEETINCNKVLIIQVINNLISNGIRAIKTLDEKWIKLKLISTEKHLEVLVEDSGNGIPQEVREKIFDPLFSTHSLSGGLGLGLNISMEILRLHRGKLTVVDGCEHTCFKVEIPKDLEEIIYGEEVCWLDRR